MQVLAHNIVAANTQRQFGINTKEKTKSAEKLSSGYRINRAADDAAGLCISEKMRSQIRGLERGEKNTQDGVSFLQVADGAMNEAHAMLQRINELCVQAANGTNSDSDRESINQEIQQIKKELSNIKENTKFNDIPVFEDCDFAEVDVSGELEPVQVFDATYKEATDEVTYGGFLFEGERISWDSSLITPQPMVDIDPVTKKQKFYDNDYTVTTTAGAKFTIRCKDDSEVPEFIRNVDIKTGPDGMFFDGVKYPWSELKDEFGEELGEENFHGGEWNMEYKGLQFHLILGMEINSYSDIQSCVNKCLEGEFSYETGAYLGTEKEQAVDALAAEQIRLTSTNVNGLNNVSDFEYTVKANEDGVWIQDKSGANIVDSKKTWAELGISSFKSGTDIQKDFVYEFADDESTADNHKSDTMISFRFTLSDITSVDSIIDGLDGMKISGSSYISNYGSKAEYKGSKPNVLAVQVTNTNYSVTLSQEKDLNRDFEDEYAKVEKSNLTVDAANTKAQLTFEGSAANVMQMQGDYSTIQTDMKNDIETYLDIVEADLLNHVLNEPGSDYKFPYNKSIATVVGSSNITGTGYLSETVTITPSTKVSDGWSVHSLDGNHIAASIDFQNINASNRDKLNGTGFDSTCLTCNNHYSVKFVKGGSVDTVSDGTNTYGYRRQDDPPNYKLEIDLDTLTSVNNGEDLANAMLTILKDSFDFHYTQYAVDGSKLYIFDEREEASSTPSRTNATFYTTSYDAATQKDYTLTLLSDPLLDNDSAQLKFTYDFADTAEDVKISMVKDSAGDYVAEYDSSGTTVKNYRKYDAAIDAGRDRYSAQKAFTLSDRTTTADKAVYLEDRAKNAVEDMLKETNLTLEAKSYSKMTISGNENPNLAVRAKFSNYVEFGGSFHDDRNLIRIQHSGTESDFTNLSRVSMNNYVLRMETANVTTQQRAMRTLANVQKGLEYLSQARSLYGAYQNRLEHTINNNGNTAENIQSTESRIRDTDMADEMVRYSKQNILEQAGQSLLAQANQSTKGVLSILG